MGNNNTKYEHHSINWSMIDDLQQRLSTSLHFYPCGSITQRLSQCHLVGAASECGFVCVFLLTDFYYAVFHVNLVFNPQW